MMEWLESHVKKIPIGILIFCFFVFVYSLTIRAQLSYGDEAARYLEAQSVVQNHNFAIPMIPDTNKIGVDGKNYNRFEFGYEALLLPPYALARTLLGVAAGRDDAPILFMGILNSIVTALTCLVLFRFSSALGVGRRISLWVTLIFGLATIAWTYSQGLFRESLQAFTLLLSVYAAVRYRQSNDARSLWMSAISLGYLIFTKTADVIFLPVILAYLIMRRQSDQMQNSSVARLIDAAKILIVFLIPMSLFLLLQSWVNIVKFGNLFAIGPTYDNNVLPYFSISNLWVGLGGFLFSPGKSLFLYSPPVVLSLFAAVVFFQKSRREATLMIFLVVLDILLYGAYYDWTSGSFWGPRYLVEIVPFMVLPIGVALDSAQGSLKRYWIGLSAVFFLTGLFVQIVGALTNARDYIDVVGDRIGLFGAWDFLRHGGIDSLAFYLSPQDGSLHITAYGWLSLGLTALFGGGLIASVKNRGDVSGGASLWRGVAVLTIAMGVSTIGLVKWAAIPYNEVLSQKADTQYVAANVFFSDGRFCEARGLYSQALGLGTLYPFESISRLDAISPRAQGVEIDIGDFINLPEPDKARVTDAVVSFGSEHVLGLVTLQEEDINAEATTDFFDVQPSTQYEFSAWLKVEGVYGSGGALIGLYEDDGNWRKPQYSELVRGRGPRGIQLARQVIKTLPTTRRALVKVGLSQAHGKISVGDIRLTKLNAGESAKPSLCQSTQGN